MAIDDAGNIYVSGNYAGTGITFGTTTITPVGNYNGYIAKLDPNGNPIWAKSTRLIQAGWDNDGNSEKIVIDSLGNVYLCGVFFTGANLNNVAITGNNNYFLAKLDSMGYVSWIRTVAYQVVYRSLNAIHLDAQQHICMTGLYQDSVGFDSNHILKNVLNPGGVNGFLTKYDIAGNVISATELGVINPIWSNQNYPLEFFQYDNEDNLYRFVTQNNVFAKYNANGILLNTDTISASTANLYIRSFAVDNNKNILFCGLFSNDPLIFQGDTIHGNAQSQNALILKLNDLNILQWHYVFQTVQTQNSYLKVRVDDIGNVYGLGSEGNSSGLSRIPVTKLSGNGNLIWNNFIWNTNPPYFTTGGYSFQPNNIVQANNGGNIIILGGFAGNTPACCVAPGYIFFDSLFNFTILPSRGDIFIA